MKDAPADRGSRGRLIASLLGSLFFVYVASVGPASVYFSKHHLEDTQPGRVLIVIYYPIIKLVELVPAVDRCASWYGDCWERIMYPKPARVDGPPVERSNQR